MLAGLQRHTAQRSHACSACSTPTLYTLYGKGGRERRRAHRCGVRRRHAQKEVVANSVLAGRDPLEAANGRHPLFCTPVHQSGGRMRRLRRRHLAGGQRYSRQRKHNPKRTARGVW